MEKIIVKKNGAELEIPVPETVESGEVFTIASQIEKFVKLFNPDSVALSRGILRDHIIWNEFHALGLDIIPGSDFRNATAHWMYAFDPVADIHCEPVENSNHSSLRIRIRNFNFGSFVLEESRYLKDLRTVINGFGEFLLKESGCLAVAVPPTVVLHCILARTLCCMTLS